MDDYKPRVDNFKALTIAAKQVAPFAVLFYLIDYFLYADNGSAALFSSMMVSTMFILGFFVIDFFYARSRLKQAMNAPAPQVIVVQQPVYMPPPGYGYPQGQQQQAYYPQQQQGYGPPPQQQGYYPPQPQQQYFPPQQQQPYYPPQQQQPYYPPQQQQPALPQAQAPVTAQWPPPQAPPPQPPAPSRDDEAWLPSPQKPQDARKRPPPG